MGIHCGLKGKSKENSSKIMSNFFHHHLQGY